MTSACDLPLRKLPFFVRRRLFAILRAFDMLRSVFVFFLALFICVRRGRTTSGPASPIIARVGEDTNPPLAKLPWSRSSSAKVKFTPASIAALPADVDRSFAAAAPAAGPPDAVAPAMKAARYRDRRALCTVTRFSPQEERTSDCTSAA